MDANNHNGKTNDFPEAPASWNTRYIDPNGFECQITLRGESGSELLEKATIAINYLLESGCTPSVFYRNGNRLVERTMCLRSVKQATFTASIPGHIYG